MCCELSALVYALGIYEFIIIIGSKHPITIFTDDKPIFGFFARKGKINARFFRYQIKFTCFPNLVVVWTQGKKLFSRRFIK